MVRSQGTRAGLMLLLLVTIAAGRAYAANDAWQEVSRLFASAAYEETLTALAKIDDPALFEKADEYRALCLLALNRSAEAERAVELLVLRNPQPMSNLQSRTPRFAELYRNVRRRLVPRLAADAYNAGRDSFAAKDYAAAARQFNETLELVHSAEDPADLHDLELLAVGFKTLAATRLVARLPDVPELSVTPELGPATLEAAPVIATNVRGPLTPASAPFAPVPRVYGAEDRDVAPPVVIDQQLPAWTPPPGVMIRHTFTGQLRVTISEDGRVISADIAKPSFSPYDELLLRTVRQWRYQPALKGGRAVQYRRVIEYVLNLPEQTASR